MYPLERGCRAVRRLPLRPGLPPGPRLARAYTAPCFLVDCDDANAAVNPGAPELCNGIDDDCDGQVDEYALNAPVWYADVDGDGYGAVDGTGTSSCSAPKGGVADDTDCDDHDATVHPGAAERCNGLDDNCDGQADEGLSALPELCNGIDDDCDGQIDEDPTDAPGWYVDADLDSYGAADGVPVYACEAPAGLVATNDDCDDANVDIHPYAAEIWYDGVDQNCDGANDYDRDGDGFAADAYAALAGLPGGDCDDTRSDTHPGAPEVCDDDVDQSCDGVADDGCPTAFSLDRWVWEDTYLPCYDTYVGDVGTGVDLCPDCDAGWVVNWTASSYSGCFDDPSAAESFLAWNPSTASLWSMDGTGAWAEGVAVPGVASFPATYDQEDGVLLLNGTWGCRTYVDPDCSDAYVYGYTATGEVLLPR